MRSNKIKVFYNPKQVLQAGTTDNFSKSPMKPKLLLEHLSKAGLLGNFDITSRFRPFNAYDFQIAHTTCYMRDFFKGGKLCTSNGLDWTPQFAESVRYTNASLYSAIKNSLVNPSEVSFSPTSGFHHARPNRGSGYCTFSGQVIASVKLWRQLGVSGCCIDLDGHFGNSIEDTRYFQPDLNHAVPVGFNFNTREFGKMYFKQLRSFVYSKLQPAIINGEIDYVVWCHGADSHEDDMLGGQVSTSIWLKCADFFWSWVKLMDETLGRPLPVSCALFGGYRKDDYDSVLSLHASDLVLCMRNLLGLDVEYQTVVKPSAYRYEELLIRDQGTQTRHSLVPFQSSSLLARKTKLEQSNDIMLDNYRNQRNLDMIGSILDDGWDRD
jgi:acetoin utilization deacetylase AcuC-like enzyme